LKYSLQHIASVVGSASKVEDNAIEYLVLDSRKIYSPAASLFFALKGDRRNGHQFIAEAYKKGIRNFIISDPIEIGAYPEASFILVKDTLDALQQLVAYHRKQFTIPVIGITGSNGKTIVKEWLYQLLHTGHTIVRSPKSYNSQIGVPLSVWQMNEQHELAIFEAGISKPGEMEKLERIIQPTIGVLTNIGDAHDEGFKDHGEKFQQKALLFENADYVVCNSIYSKQLLKKTKGKLFCWGTWRDDDVKIISIKKQANATFISLKGEPFRQQQEPEHLFNFTIPFTDDASIENAISCFTVCYLLSPVALQVKPGDIAERMKLLYPVNMRLELKRGINHCSVINDSYSADLSSFEIALNFLNHQNTGTKKTVILSDFLQSGLKLQELYGTVFESLKKHNVARFIGIGQNITKAFSQLTADHSLKTELYASTEEFIKQFRSTQFKEETILIKGARVFGFERIVQLFEQKVHQTVLEINLNAIAHNLKVYQSHLQPSTKVMAMVKAFAYGSGGAEIAGILQYHKVDWLGVAYADEGVELRKAGITLPIMVMNPEESAFNTLIEYNLEPDIYSFELLSSFDTFLQNEGLQQYPVHIEIETGMNRLGFAIDETDHLADYLQKASSLKVQTVFSHLAAGEDPKEDDFTLMQFDRFTQSVLRLKEKLHYSFFQHIANSAAVFRFPQLQLDMVRLGIGLYGVDSGGSHQEELQAVATLKSTIAQIKKVKAGESVSYNRRGVVNRDSTIATIRIGYADGFSRRFGNNTGKMWLKARLPDGQGELVPVIGTVCMDMTMIDITGIENVKEGDEVIIFGRELPVQQLAEWAGTIPYEIMTGISQRVKRVYFEE
jgi:alanine racemase